MSITIRVALRATRDHSNLTMMVMHADEAALATAAVEEEAFPVAPRPLVFGAPNANVLKVALIGLVNSGKTTLYDALRGRPVTHMLFLTCLPRG